MSVGTPSLPKTAKCVMPVRGRGAIPRPDAVYREQGTERPRIVEYRALKKLPKSQDALALLRSVGAAVRPIMVKQGWHLPLLVEMWPKSDNLLGLNINRGQKIALRLRRPFDQNDFLDEEAIIETMLHELTHNLRGPHDEIFFTHLEQLTEEWYELRSTGRLAGQGFLAPGSVLGGRAFDPFARPSPLSGTRVSAQRLGGSGRSQSPRRAAFEAAERRRTIAAGCPSSDATSSLLAEKEQEEQERIQGVDVIVIDDDDNEDSRSRLVPLAVHVLDDSDEDEDEVIIVRDNISRVAPPVQRSRSEGGSTPCQLTRQFQDAAALRASLMQTHVNHPPVPNLAPQPISSEIDMRSRSWTCQACTLYNPADALRCSACSSLRPGVEHWTCRACAHVMLGSFAQFWCCSRCGIVKVA